MTTHKIQILGPGCPKCQRLTASVAAAADALGLDYELEKVTDVLRFADFGVMVTPALVLDGRVLVAGRVPGEPELCRLLTPTTEVSP